MYDYLLWGIPWINVRLMLDDSARTVDDEPYGEDNKGNVEKRELTTKEDIINYIKGMM